MAASKQRVAPRFLPAGVAAGRSVALLVVALLAAAWPSAATRAQEATQQQQAPQNESFVVEGEDARVRLTFYRPDVARVNWQPRAAGRDSLEGSDFEGALDTSLAVIRTPGEAAERPAVQRRETPEEVLLRTEALTVVVEKAPLRLRFFGGDGAPLVSGAPEGGFAAQDTAQALRFAIGPETRFYGTGERGSGDGSSDDSGGGIDLRGRAFRSYNTQRFGYVEAPATMKINVPLLTTSGGYALFFDSPWPGYFDIGAEQAGQLRYTAANQGEPARGALTYYLIAGEAPREQLEGYTWLTGRQPMPPRWSLGYIQSKFGYRSVEAARGVVDTLFQKNIPVSALVLDLYWFEDMGDLDWREEGTAWDEPMAFLRDLEERGVKAVTITEPYITTDSELFEEAAAEGYLGERSNGEPYVMEDWWSCTAGAAFATEAEEGGECNVALLDITDPEAQDWWWSQYPEFMQSEVDGFWTDLGEPERHPRDMMHELGPTARVHNVYNLLWAQTLYQGFHAWRPNERIFNLTRAGYAGIQRYGTFLWSGDVARSFTTLDAQLPLMLNAGLSGLGFYSSDLGGFTGDFYSPELYARWVAMGAFTPTMRTHGQDDLPTAPWGFGEEVERIVRRYIRLRYRMLPYNYALARENHERGTPLARPLFFASKEAGAEEALRSYDDAFLWGEALLVAPVTQEGQRTKAVALPEGAVWTDYWTGRRYDGGQTVQVEAPLGRVPLFAKAGSIVPMRASPRPMDAPFDTLALDIFPHEKEAARFTFYEDDGTSQDYRQGAYAKTRLVQRWASDSTRSDSTRSDSSNAGGVRGGAADSSNASSNSNASGNSNGRTLQLHIGPAAGGYEGLPSERLWRADIRHVAGAPSAVLFDGEALEQHATREALYETGSGYVYDAEAERLVVQHGGATSQAHQLTARGVRLAR